MANAEGNGVVIPKNGVVEVTPLANYADVRQTIKRGRKASNTLTEAEKVRRNNINSGANACATSVLKAVFTSEYAEYFKAAHAEVTFEYDLRDLADWAESQGFVENDNEEWFETVDDDTVEIDLRSKLLLALGVNPNTRKARQNS